MNLGAQKGEPETAGDALRVDVGYFGIEMRPRDLNITLVGSDIDKVE